MESSRCVTWIDASARLARFERTMNVFSPNGAVTTSPFVEQKHPPSFAETQAWIEAAGLRAEACFGDRNGAPYTPESPRAIFKAAKT
jgi:hypothetical protein